MESKEPDSVYILTRSTSGRLHTCKNPSFREDCVKIDKNSLLYIGKTSTIRSQNAICNNENNYARNTKK